MLGNTINLYKNASSAMARYQEALNKYSVKLANWGLELGVNRKAQEATTTASTTGLRNELGLLQKGFPLGTA
jgi:hypothetical protein